MADAVVSGVLDVIRGRARSYGLVRATCPCGAVHAHRCRLDDLDLTARPLKIDRKPPCARVRRYTVVIDVLEHCAEDVA